MRPPSETSSRSSERMPSWGSDEAPSRLLPLPAAGVIRWHLSIFND
jgi:hypothetical protein